MIAHQQGSGALTGVLLLLVMSAALLHATRRQLDDSLSLVADERQFIRQFNQAESALGWGSRQNWPPQKKAWQCKTDLRFGWRACLSAVNEERYLLSGDSGAGTIIHYQWMERGGEPGRVKPVPHGWIDFCPLAQPERCSPDA